MSKFNPKDLNAGFGSVDDLNENFANLEAALNNTLSRDGTTPNAMEDDLDMNSNRVINVADPIDANDVATLQYLEDNYGTGAVTSANDAATSAAEAAADAAQASADAASAAASEAAAAASASTAASAAATVVEGRRLREEFIVTAGQTTITTTNEYDEGYIDVYVDGWHIHPDEYTDTDGNDIVFTTPFSGGEEVVVIIWGLLVDAGNSLLAANNLSDVSSAATSRTNLGVAIGSDVQAYDATLAALAGLATGANKVPYSTGTDTFGQLDFLDEDTMASDSATAVASQQSIKAYIDAQVLASGNLGYTLIETQTASASASLDFTTGLDSTYDQYVFKFSGLKPATDGVSFYMRVSTDGGASYDSSSSYEYQTQINRSQGTAKNIRSTGNTVIALAQTAANYDVGNNTGEGIGTGSLDVWLGSADVYFTVCGEIGIWNSGNGVSHSSIVGGWRGSATAVNAIQFFFQSGNIASGSISLYGVKK